MGWPAGHLFHEAIADPLSASETSLEFQSVVGVLLAGEFSLTEALVVKCYYPLQMTMKQTGRAVGLTESRVSQIHKDVMGRLRAKLPAAA